MITNKSRWLRILLIIAVIFVANILLSRLFLRLDFTGDKRYTLSQPTKNILKNLDDPVTVTAYFSKDLPPQIASAKTEFKDLLEEFNKRSGGDVVYEFINPNESEESERVAQTEGIQPITVNMRERDQVKQQRAYLGAVIKYGNLQEVLPFVQPGAGMEYALASSIKKITVENKPKIAFVQGHGEPSVQEMAQVAGVMSVLFELTPVTLDTLNAANYKGLALVAPKDSFQLNELNKIDEFLRLGKGVYVAINRVEADIQQSRGSSLTTGVESWLAQKGVEVQNNFILDRKCGSVSVQQSAGFFSFNRQVQFPYLPIIQDFADHPITNGLEQSVLQFASSLAFTSDSPDISITPLAFTSSQSGTSDAPLMFDISKQWTNSDYPLSKLPVAAAIEGKLVGDVVSKMVVIGDGDFAVNGAGQQARQLNPDDVSFMVNAVEWLNDDTGLGELRTKEVTSRPLKRELSDTNKNIVRWGNFLLPIVGIILFGLVRMTLRNRKKKQWREERYV